MDNTLVVDSKVQVVRAENLATPDRFQADASVYDGIRFDSTGRRLDSMPQPAAMEPATWNVSVNGGSARYNVPLAPVNASN